MVSELRSRNLKSPPGEVGGDGRPHDAADGKKGDGDTAGSVGPTLGGGVLGRLLDWDRRVTLKCSVCAAPASGLTLALRYFFKVMEISGHGVPWIVLPLTLLWISDDEWMQEFLLNLLAGIFLDLVVSVVLKAAVRRPRPAVNKNDMFLAFSVDSKFSFPSGHCTRAAMLAVLFLASLRLTAAQVAAFLLWVLGIGASRLCLGRHYVTDIVCGMAIGSLQGLFILQYWLPIETFNHLKNSFTT